MSSANLLRESINFISEYEKDSKNHSNAKLVSVYEALLQKYPHLEGFWVRYAHTQFQLQRTPQAAVTVFERALGRLNLQYSLTIWVAYLKFLVHVCYTGRDRSEYVEKQFERARELIGKYFLSHEFWDLYLEASNEPVNLMLTLLDECTVHQFTKYYDRLISLLEFSQDLSEFKSLMPLEVQNIEINAEELPQIRAVILSKLKLKHELHSRRVKQVWPFEQKIRRAYFFPGSLPPDTLNWVQYIENSDDKLLIYRRALIPCAEDPKMWLSYIRYHIQQGDPQSIREAYAVPVEMGIVPVLLHFALWLEWQQNFDEAGEVYTRASALAPEQTNPQLKQYTLRRGGRPVDAQC